MPCLFVFPLLSDPYDVVKLFPNLLPPQARQKVPADAILKLEDIDLESGLLALIEFLTNVRRWNFLSKLY